MLVKQLGHMVESPLLGVSLVNTGLSFWKKRNRHSSPGALVACRFGHQEGFSTTILGWRSGTVLGRWCSLLADGIIAP
jgi:hypothetical protein